MEGPKTIEWYINYYRDQGHIDRLHALHDFWNTHTEQYDKPINPWSAHIIKTVLNRVKPQFLFEVGCGTGQSFPLYKSVPKVLACDWSEQMIHQAENRVKELNATNIELAIFDITTEDRPSLISVADLTITHCVLMHIPPDFIENTIRNLVADSRQILVMEYFERNVQPRLWFHNWLHDYPSLFKKAGCELVEEFHSDEYPKAGAWQYKTPSGQNG